MYLMSFQLDFDEKLAAFATTTTTFMSQTVSSSSWPRMQYVDVTASVKDYDGVEICVCVWEREREGDTWRRSAREIVCVCVCVCVWERFRESKKFE